ncbi:MAG TPA: hypothetical protein P5560_10710 [Thermotogota bacterium]|nr:hypothetical protein [Thermotogota bacterium]HRW93408.1 hypothetical protein [Thermotogota bacterium]
MWSFKKDFPAWTDEKLQQVYMDILQKAGYEPRVDSDGDVVFKKENMTFVIQPSGKDPIFFRLFLPNIYPVESEEERGRIRVAMDMANALCKAAKVFTVNNNVWVSIEFFVNHPQDVETFLERALGAIDNAAKIFVVRLNTLDA